MRAAARSAIRIVGSHPGDMLGASVARIGDFNGDGRDDIAIGAPGTTRRGRANVGAAYVVLGRRGKARAIHVADAGDGVVAVWGARTGDALGTSVAGVGDINGDGLADVAIGAPRADGRVGAVYVLFGSRRPPRVMAASDPSWGFVLRGNDSFSPVGEAVAGAGDVNGDSIPDLGVGVLEREEARTAAAKVVFGPLHSGTAATTRTAAGFMARTPESQWFDRRRPQRASRVPVAGVGDTDGDGLNDIAFADPGNGPFQPGSASVYVAFGKRDDHDIVTAGNTGFWVFTPHGLGGPLGFGRAMTAVPDATGDGRSDIAASEVRSQYSYPPEPGSIYVFPGDRASDVRNRNLTMVPGVVRIWERELGDLAGYSLTGLTVRTDGMSGLVVGAPGRRDQRCRSIGAVFVVRPVLGRWPLSLGDPAGVYEILGSRPAGAFGTSVAATSGFVRPGAQELVIGEPGFQRDDRAPQVGHAYVVPLPRKPLAGFGHEPPRLCVKLATLTATAIRRHRTIKVEITVNKSAVVTTRIFVASAGLGRRPAGSLRMRVHGPWTDTVSVGLSPAATRGLMPGTLIRLRVAARDHAGNRSVRTVTWRAK
jgi:glycosylphosphatidylinositol phospholipase D